MRPHALLLLVLLAAPAGAGAQEPEPQPERVTAGTIACYPETAEIVHDPVLGANLSGTFQLWAYARYNRMRGVSDTCTFAVVADTNATVWYGGVGTVTDAVSIPCTSAFVTPCEPTSTFSWTRPLHGICFETPYRLYANDIHVGTGTLRFCDPPQAVVDLANPLLREVRGLLA